MKKCRLIIICIILFLIIILPFTKIRSDNNKTIKLAEVTHSVFYAPLYVSIENGYFQDKGIDIDLVLTSGADKVSSAVLSGDAQIGFAGAESALYIYEKNPKDYLQIFSGLTKRDGQFIVGKKSNHFDLTDLYGKEILVGRKTGMPALNFISAMRNAGIDISKININYSVDFSSLSGAYIGGTGDYVNLFEPNVLTLEKNGYGKALLGIGKLSGEMPYTVFYAKKSFIKNNGYLIKDFNKAVDMGLDFINTHTAYDVALVISHQFPDLSINDLEVIIKRYKNNDSWLSNHQISEKLLNNIEDLLIENGLLQKRIGYKDIIYKGK